MAECEYELKFYLTGRVTGKTERANVAIEALNLGHTDQSNRGLIGRRKAMVDTLIYDLGAHPEGLQFEDEELLRLAVDDLETPDAEQRLQAFSPVLINVIRHFLTQP